jgi:hypothetical protein
MSGGKCTYFYINLFEKINKNSIIYNFFYFKKRKAKVDSAKSAKKSGAHKKKSSGKARSKGKPKVMSFNGIENGSDKYDDEDEEKDKKHKNEDK